jgi:hypothetical protein
MVAKFRSICYLILIVAAFSTAAAAQDDRILPKPDDPSQWPKAVLENKARMLIEESKKEHDTLLRRGDDAVEIAEKLERLASGATVRPKDVADKLDDLEKVVRKIRDDLNGDDDEGDLKDDEFPQDIGIKSLHALVLKLNDELKKTTRFSISAAAIDRSNAVLKMIHRVRARN